jgi:dCMP deaminase
MNSRICWSDVWMNLSFDLSKRSPDPKHKVGAVIVTAWFGYNGDEAGGNNQRDSTEHGKSGFIHAEANALIKMDYSDTRDKKIYLTLSPCVVCARMIINAKTIKEIIYAEKYDSDTRGLDILKERGIIVRKMEVKQ